MLLPYHHEGDILLHPTKGNCLLDYDEISSRKFLSQQFTLLLNAASSHSIVDVILEKNENSYSIVGLNYPASPTYINKELNKHTTSLNEKPGLTYDGKQGNHWNWSFGVFSNDELEEMPPY
jgi:hypothetical protein